MNELNFILVIAFVALLQSCTPDAAPKLEPRADDIADGQVQNRGAGTGNWWDKLPRPEWSKYERVAVDDNWFGV